MAKSKANKDKEEKSGSNAPDDDDDFGLPELEYEALDDDEPVAETPPEVKPPVASVTEPEPEATHEKEEEPAEAEEPQPQMGSSVFDESRDDPKVSSIFDMEEPDQEEISNVFSGGGSSTVENKPIYESNGDDAKSFTRIIIIGAISFVLIGFGFLYWHHKDDDKKPVAQTQPKEQKAEPVPVKEPEPVKPAVVEEPVKTGPAEVVTLTDRTGRSYVIVGSFFDGDLANDYGQELAAQGISATIIKPFGKSKFYRVSIADYGTYTEAMDEAEKAKSSYGGEVWALRY